MKHLVLICLYSCSVVFSFSQSIRIKSLTVGDMVPPLTIEKVLNYKGNRFSLSEFKGKLVILDFWETFCGSCVEPLPAFQELQNNFSNQLQFITLTSLDSKAQLLARLNNYKILKNFRLPIVYQDQQVRKYFPFELLSHFVWIDKNGKVIAITDKQYVNKENIQDIIDGKRNYTEWPVKSDVINFDKTKPLLAFSNKSFVDTTALFYSGFSGYLEGINQTNETILDTVRHRKIVTYYNTSVLRLCMAAIEGRPIGSPDLRNIIFDVNDKSRYVRGSEYRVLWERKNAYTYSTSVPIKTSDLDLRSIVSADISKWLLLVQGITVSKENRRVKSLVIIDANTNPRAIVSKGGNRSSVLENKKLMIRNAEFEDFLWYLDKHLQKLPKIYNKSSISGKTLVDIGFDFNEVTDVHSLRNELLRNGLDVIEEMSEREVYVVREK